MAECIIFGYKIHVEVPLFLIFFCFQLSGAVYTNLIIYRTCYVILGYNQSECALLGSEHKDSMTEHLEQLVEPSASVINMAGSIIEGLGSSIACLFIGPWSDKFGRKPVIFLSLLSFTFGYFIKVLLCLFPYVSPWYFLIASIPVTLSGGFASMITSMLSYITDITSVANRGMRMGIFEATLTLGILLGNLLGPYLFYATSYTIVFVICGFCCLVATVFTYFLIPESLGNAETNDQFSGVFKISHIKEMYKTTMKKRDAYKRGIVLCCIAILAVYILVINGSSSLMFLYLRDKFEWSLKTYQMYNCVCNIIYVTGTIVGVYVLHKLLNVTESVLVLTGFISLLNCALLQGLAVKSWHIYFSSAVHGLSGVISPLVRSMISKCVDAADIGKIFSVIIVLESLSGLLGSPLYTAVYNATIKTDPGIFNYLSSGFYMFDIIMIVSIIWMEFQSCHPYTKFDNNEACNNVSPDVDALGEEVSALS